MRTKTLDEVKLELARKGITMASWAAANGFSYTIVQQVLKGRLQGKYGEAHRIAVKLGIKDGELVEPDQVPFALAMPARQASTADERVTV